MPLLKTCSKLGYKKKAPGFLYNFKCCGIFHTNLFVIAVHFKLAGFVWLNQSASFEKSSEDFNLVIERNFQQQPNRRNRNDIVTFTIFNITTKTLLAMATDLGPAYTESMRPSTENWEWNFLLKSNSNFKLNGTCFSQMIKLYHLKNFNVVVRNWNYALEYPVKALAIEFKFELFMCLFASL